MKNKNVNVVWESDILFSKSRNKAISELYIKYNTHISHIDQLHCVYLIVGKSLYNKKTKII